MFETFVAIMSWLVTVGTNGSVYSFLMNNALLIGLVILITPTKKDDNIWQKVKDKLSTFKSGGEGSDAKKDS